MQRAHRRPRTAGRRGAGGTVAAARTPGRHPVPGTRDAARSAGRPSGRRTVVDPHRKAAFPAPASRFPRHAGRGIRPGRLFRFAPDAEPARGARLYVRRGGRHGQLRTGGLFRRSGTGRDGGHAGGPARDLRRNRTAALRADARGRTFAREEHYGRRDDAYPRRAVRHCRRYDREHPLRPRPYRHQREHPPHTGHDAGRRAATGSEIPLPRRTGDGHCGRPAKIDACALRLRSNTPPAERHEKSTGIPVLFHFRIRYTLSALPARHPTARTRTQTAVSDVHDPPRLFPVGRDPVGQLHEIGDRELLGALRKKGMFCAAEIAEYRPQRVADHLAALAE